MSDNQNSIPEENNSDITPSEEINQDTNAAEEKNDTANENNTEQSEPDSEQIKEESSESIDSDSEQTKKENTEDTAPESENTDNEKYAFEWNYTTISDAPPKSKPRQKRTGLIFGITAGCIFLIAILALVISIIVGVMMGTFRTGSQNTVDYNTQINVSGNNTSDLPDDASSELIESFKHSTVVVLCDTGTGTGIILDDNGMIVTNHHVIEDASTISVYLYDGRNYSATLIGSDAYNDIAVIKIDAPDLVPATFANSDNTYTGQRVYAVGTPAGPEFAWSVSAGIVSHPSRELKFYNDDGLLERSLYLIQTDALVNPGNSGGPLVNTRCEVMGIVTMRLSDDFVGMGFAIPTNTALPIIESIIENYIAPPSIPSSNPQLGITGIVVSKGERFIMSSMGFKDIVTEDYYNRYPDKCKYASHAGIYVITTSEGFDAASKLKEGDIIIGADKKLVSAMEDLKQVITSKKIGDTISLTIIRDGQQQKVNVVLGRAVQ